MLWWRDEVGEPALVGEDEQGDVGVAEHGELARRQPTPPLREVTCRLTLFSILSRATGRLGRAGYCSASYCSTAGLSSLVLN